MAQEVESGEARVEIQITVGVKKEEAQVDWNAMNNSRAGLIWFNHFEKANRKKRRCILLLGQSGVSDGISQ